VLVADTLLDETGRIKRSAGILVQALPDGDRERLAEIGRQLTGGRFAELLLGAGSTDDLLRATVPEAERVDVDLPLQWFCPCSRDRAENAVRLMGQPELAHMVVEGQPVVIDCDFCRSTYEFSIDELGQILADLTTTRA
jgi:molecular chaperone Hsp33